MGEPRLTAQFEKPATSNPLRPYSVPAHPHYWLRYPAGGDGWRICKWCALTQSPEEQDAPIAREGRAG